MPTDLQPRRNRWYDPPARPAAGQSATDLCIRFLALVLLATAVFALGDAMVHNHFFTGGALNNHQGHLVGPR